MWGSNAHWENCGRKLKEPGADSRYQIPVGMTKQAYLEARLADAITEEDDYDLMVMGRTQGQGCYCFVNGLVQTQIQKLQSNYRICGWSDDEAGMEHISRGLIPTMEIAGLDEATAPEEVCRQQAELRH